MKINFPAFYMKSLLSGKTYYFATLWQKILFFTSYYKDLATSDRSECTICGCILQQRCKIFVAIWQLQKTSPCGA